MTIKDYTDYVILAGAVATAIIALGILARTLIVRPIRKWIQSEISPTLAVVRTELTEDEGRSMKDAIVRIENRIATLDKRFGDHLQLHTQAHE